MAESIVLKHRESLWVECLVASPKPGWWNIICMWCRRRWKDLKSGTFYYCRPPAPKLSLCSLIVGETAGLCCKKSPVWRDPSVSLILWQVPQFWSFWYLVPKQYCLVSQSQHLGRWNRDRHTRLWAFWAILQFYSNKILQGKFLKMWNHYSHIDIKWTCVKDFI